MSETVLLVSGIVAGIATLGIVIVVLFGLAPPERCCVEGTRLYLEINGKTENADILIRELAMLADRYESGGKGLELVIVSSGVTADTAAVCGLLANKYPSVRLESAAHLFK